MSATYTVADGVGRVVLDHRPVNILTRDVLARLRGILDQAAADTSLRCLLVSARGKHFSAGADVAEHLPPHFQNLIPEFIATVAALDAFPVPVIAAVQGRCLGGGLELVLAADIVLAATGARLGQPEIALGVLPPAACVLLPGRCTAGATAELLFTGEPLDAAEALLVGLVHRVVPDAELDCAADALAARIARHSAAALRATKRVWREAIGDRRAALQRAGRAYVDDLMRTHDAVEGLRAFVEKRAAAWSHA
jgi:cyclohexa-1,5-dienecarbonyl-CoA hydratase